MTERSGKNLPTKIEGVGISQFETWARQELPDLIDFDPEVMFSVQKFRTGSVRHFHRKPDRFIPPGPYGWQLDWRAYEKNHLATLNSQATGESTEIIDSSQFLHGKRLFIEKDDSYKLKFSGSCEAHFLGEGPQIQKYPEGSLSTSLNMNTLYYTYIPASRYYNRFDFDYEGKLIYISITKYGGFLQDDEGPKDSSLIQFRPVNDQGIVYLPSGGGRQVDLSKFEHTNEHERVIVEKVSDRLRIIVFMRSYHDDVDYEITVPLALQMETVLDHADVPRRRIVNEELLVPDELRRHPDSPLSDLDGYWKNADILAFVGAEVKKHNPAPRAFNL